MIPAFTDSLSGQSLNLSEDILYLAERQGQCVCQGITLSAAAVVDALTNGRAAEWKVLNNSLPMRPYLYHDLNWADRQTSFGTVVIPAQTSLPTAVETALAACFLNGYVPELQEGKQTIAFILGATPRPELANLIRSVWACNADTFFHRSSSSVVQDAPAGYDTARVSRYVGQCYENYGRRYGFLELFRAAETCFYAGLLSKLNREFLSNPKRITKEVSSALDAEARMINVVISESGAIALGEEVADRVHRLRTQNNSFAAELFRNFERRTEKDNSKTFRAAVYLFQVRCSIAHAGQDGLIYEEFDDADAVLIELFELFEEILLHALGIRTPTAIPV